ncbi:NAD-dependent protein deacetylase SRT1 [Tetrabaena socialis]|uniref:protein acetyllysine N-acetyltransferase n=1 Tax=Tetrabaena socialis TaxID=47790 RepID=A0A2J7ZU94_9CHLO|nr:NAD-dependent protein deacetylase SRT1 [Tetrabaena socialis]|eukprot:PNH03818.1 NAD-dependent protein deacetylase SRT1 [Tetrabaena socialis]
MSLGYADRLKQRRNLGGQLGAQEYHQSFEDIAVGVKSLAQWVSNAERVFVFTGAGISTACGIPDFRGPNGIWTLRKKKAPVPTDFTPFEFAKPSFTHMAISALVASGKAPHVCSQNVDSLHLWSGVPRDRIAELHGNCFAERCTSCKKEYARDFQMETVNFKPSGRRCPAPGCGGPLVDNILDWDTTLPEDELNESVRQAEGADVALVLGTSLQIQPANELPTLTRDEGGKMVIVNLQKTPKDRRANLIIRGRVDLVMALLMQELRMQVPPYIRTESLVVRHSCSSSAGASASGGGGGGSSGSAGRALTVVVGSRHGPGCPLPMVERLSLTLEAEAEGAAGGGSGEGGGGGGEGRVKEEDEAGCSGGGGGGGAAWGPVSSGELAPAGGGGGGFSHTFAGVPGWVRRVRCTLQVRLVKWADAERRDVRLQHSIDLGELGRGGAAAPPASASGDQGGSGGDVKPLKDLPPAADGSPSTAAAAGSSSGDGGVEVVVRHSFVSQRLQYDAAEVVAAFRAAPPPVVMPEPPRKRARKEGSPAAPTRVSARQSRNSQRAQYAEESASSQDGGGSGSGEEEGGS